MAEKCVCETCQNEFPEGTELFPKLIVTRDERVARELMDDKAEVLLCMKCWFADVKRIPSEDLAMAMLALLKKVRSLESSSSKNWTDVIEKMKQPQPWQQPTWVGPYSPPGVVYPGPHTVPNTGPGDVWIDDNCKQYAGTAGTLPGTLPPGWTYTSADRASSDGRGFYVGTKGDIQGSNETGNQEKPKINP